VVNSGASIDPNSGLLGWTPGISDTGSTPFTVRVTDPNGNFDEEAFSVDVPVPASSGPALYRINAGGAAFTDSAGNSWVADTLFNTGAAFSVTDPILGTIDEVLYQHPKVADAVAVGIADEYRGETVKAFVVPKEGETITEEDIIGFCKEKLAAYKIPKMVEFRSELPKSAVGKILRKVLRDEEATKMK